LLRRGTSAELRFFREALLTARLEHPGIVPVHEAGRWEDGTPFYAMKLVAGRPLSELIAEKSAAVERRALIPNLAAVSEAVAYAHDRRIVHRDLKPSNVIVGDFGETIVIDWGLAKDLDGDEDVAPGNSHYAVSNAGLTTTGAVLGTPAYMAPEQARGDGADARADVYAIGVMLQELATDSSGVRARTDDDLRSIIERATAADREQRYASARELSLDLRAYLAGDRISARRYSLPAAIRHWVRHHRGIAVAAVAGALVAIVTITSAVFRVVRERDRAARAQASAETALVSEQAQRRTAVLAQTELLAERDPTAAWELLVANQLGGVNRILSARIQSAGVAARSFVYPRAVGFTEISLIHPGLISVVTPARTLAFVDVMRGEALEVDRDLTNPAAVLSRGDRVAYVKRRGGSFALAISTSTGETRQVTSLPEMPADLAFDGRRLYWQDSVGDVHEIDADSGDSRVIASDAVRIIDVDGGVAVCRRDQSMAFHEAGRGIRVITGFRCNGDHPLRSTGLVLAAASSENTLDVFDGTSTRRVDFDRDMSSAKYVVARSGLVAGVRGDGTGLILRPGKTTVDEVALGSDRAVKVAVGGSLAGWGFSDGSIIVRDAERGSTWTIKAHANEIACMFVDAAASLLTTCSRNEVRVWALRESTPRVVATFPGLAFNAIPSSDGDSYLLDGSSGEARTIALDGRNQLLHRHANVAFGAAWCGRLACTGGWDNAIFCSEPGASSTVTRIGTVGPVRWITSMGDDCVYASSDGTIATIVTRQVLDVLDEEPRRVRAAPDAKSVVVSDDGGNLEIIQPATNEIRRRKAAHAGSIIDAAWMGSQIVSAGEDGYIRYWSSSLDLIREIDLKSPAVTFAHSNGRFAVVTLDQRLHVFDCEGDRRRVVQLGELPSTVALSPGGDAVTIGTMHGDLLTVHVDSDDIDAYRITRSRLACVTYVGVHDILVSSVGGVFRLDMNSASKGDL